MLKEVKQTMNKPAPSNNQPNTNPSDFEKIETISVDSDGSSKIEQEVFNAKIENENKIHYRSDGSITDSSSVDENIDLAVNDLLQHDSWFDIRRELVSSDNIKQFTNQINHHSSNLSSFKIFDQHPFVAFFVLSAFLLTITGILIIFRYFISWIQQKRKPSHDFQQHFVIE